MEHDHNFLSTKGPGQSARDPLSGLRAATGATDAELRASVGVPAESTYTVHVDRAGEVPVVSVGYAKLGIAIWTDRPMSSEADWMELITILRDG